MGQYHRSALAHLLDVTLQTSPLALAHVLDATLQTSSLALAHLLDATLETSSRAPAHVFDATLLDVYCPVRTYLMLSYWIFTCLRAHTWYYTTGCFLAYAHVLYTTLVRTYLPIGGKTDILEAMSGLLLLSYVCSLSVFAPHFAYIYIYINPALQPNSKRTICDWQRLGPAAWISDRVLPTWFPESINRPHIRAGVLKISQGTDNVKRGCTHRQPTRKRTCANLLTIVPTVIAAQ